jgi:hypothetical protein
VFYVEAEKEAAAAAAALATRAAGWKKGSDGNDLGIPNNDLLALLLRLIETYVSVTAEERLTIALWILHTHVFHQFHFTPRLLVISPIENCGKTTVLRLIEQLAYEPNRSGGTTAASIYHQLEHTPGITLLIDEVDNLNLFNDPKMRQVFNYGHEVDGVISRFVGGQPRKYVVGAPLALGTIGTLPRPLMSRSIAINMHRSPDQLKLFDETDRAFIVTREAIQKKWAARCTLSREPETPAGFQGRIADNWRPLLAIADDLGVECGEAARAAAVILGSDRQYENPNISRNLR